MSHGRTSFLAIAGLALLSMGSTCKDGVDTSCPAVVGTYLATYQRLDGSCQANFESNSLNVDKTKDDMVTKIENRLTNTVITEVTFKGCTIGLKQSVDAEGKTVSMIDGQLAVESESSLKGMVTRTEYGMDGSIACHGVYDASFTRDDVVIGGAAQHAQTAP
ncbi:MAG TPA: hypothetical protein VHM19_16505 [Polyangiales bacterium]|jgi:hypothetical protein|nr:hypothetical protein [Polyangiales bacterium]